MSATTQRPRPALRPIPLVSESYQLASSAAATTQLLNLYPEKMPEGARSTFILKSDPGTEEWRNVGTGPILASATLAGALWVVSGTQAWVIPDNNNSPILLGDVGTAVGGAGDAVSGTVTIGVGLTGVVFCVPPRAYVANFDTVSPTFHQITTGTPVGNGWPDEGASSVCYLDGYYVFTSFSGTYFFTSRLLAPLEYDSLSFVYISTEVDYVEQCVAFNGELWLFGQNMVRVWHNTGSKDNPFQPRVGGLIPHGYGARRTIQNLDGSLWWLGIDNVVYRSKGYTAERVSTHALEEILADYDGGFLRTISACGYMHDGHAFYALSLPLEDAGRTFVFDAAVDKWHERNSRADGLGRWDINTASQLSARTVLGSSVNGQIFHQRANIYTENGVHLPRTAALPMILSHGARSFMSLVEIEMEVGTPAASLGVALHWSDDGGVNYGPTRSLVTGGLGKTRARVRTTRLGSFRQRILRIISPTAITIYGVDAQIDEGVT
jgi:hypothetical protein